MTDKMTDKQEQKEQLSKVLEAFRTLHRLKHLPRQGVIQFGFKRNETDCIAAHSFMVAWIALVLAKELEALGGDINVESVLETALVHDWGEAVFGDVGTIAKQALGDKLRDVEKEAFACLVGKLKAKDKTTEAFDAYEDKCKNPRIWAIVKFADAFDPWLQALVTPSRWWPAWEAVNRKAEKALDELLIPVARGEKKEKMSLGEAFRRISDLARDADVTTLLPGKPSLLCDEVLLRMQRFFKRIYCLKELPRHGFAIFGMNLSETDSVAAHGFTTASLALLLARTFWDDTELTHRAVKLAIAHDLSAALTGDISFDLRRAIANRQPSENERDLDAVERDLVEGAMEGLALTRTEIGWADPASDNDLARGLMRVAAALDAWEMGVTTPSSWMYAWEAYQKQVEADLGKMKLKNDDKALLPWILKEGCSLLEKGKRTGTDFDLRPVRLPVERATS